MSGAASLTGLVVAVVLGGGAGWLMNRFVGWMLAEIAAADAAVGDDPPPARLAPVGWTAAGGCLVAGGLWWWEVIAGGLLPSGVVGPATETTAVLGRVASHLLFFWFLAAAAWIDIRYRVIPDVITTPGVLLALLVAWCLPESFLPVEVMQSRSFAAPVESAAGLAAWGTLASPTAGPSLVAGGIVLGLFLLWWATCTAPFFEVAAASAEGCPRRIPAWLAEPRLVILVGGCLGCLVAAWCGGLRFAALESALIGFTVSAGLVWLTRVGATWALGREAMGMGDVTLMAMVGAWLGWQPAVLTFFLATFLGLGHGLFQIVRHRENELPYGPSLCLAAALITVFWRPVWRLSQDFFVDVLQLGLVLGLVVILTAVTLFIWRWLRGLGEPAA